MAEKTLTYNTSEKFGKNADKIDITSSVYLRCLKLYAKYKKTGNSGVKDFLLAKNVADIGEFGKIVIRLEYFEVGKLKTKLIFIACFHNLKRTSKMEKLNEPRSEFEISIQSCFDSFIKINKILNPEVFSSAASHSGAQQTKTASELGNLFNCNVSDCEFVLCQSQEQKSHLASPETDKQLNITNEIIGKKSADWLRLKNPELMDLKRDPKKFKIGFCKNLRINCNICKNNDEFSIEEMQSLFKFSDSIFQTLIKSIESETKNHFSAPKCVALSEKSDLLQKLKENFGLKSVSEETTSSTGNPSALHVAEETELHEATEQNQVEEMKELIDRDLTLLNTRDRDGKSSLHVACEMDNTEAAECLLCYPDCLVDIADKYGKYALHYAAENGNVDIIKLLLKREAFSVIINKTDVNGETALYLACKYGRTEAVELLLSQYNWLVYVGREKIPIHCAAENGYVEILKLLLQEWNCALYMLNKRDKDRDTALHLACTVGNFEVVKFLLSYGNLDLDLDLMTDKWGDTCFHNAALSKDCNILSELLRKKNNLINLPNKNGRTALHVAASIRNDTVIKYLLNFENCDANVKDKNGDTPLHLYVDGYKHTYFDIRRSDINVFKQKCSFLVNIANNNKETPLHRAVLVADYKSVNKLIEMGARIDKKNKNGHKPLHLANDLVNSFKKKLILSYLKSDSNRPVKKRSSAVLSHSDGTSSKKPKK